MVTSGRFKGQRRKPGPTSPATQVDIKNLKGQKSERVLLAKLATSVANLVKKLLRNCKALRLAQLDRRINFGFFKLSSE
jgi:hypothetical protein